MAIVDPGAYHPQERDHPQLRVMRYWRNALTRGIEVVKMTQPGTLAGVSERDVTEVIRLCAVFIAEDQRLDCHACD